MRGIFKGRDDTLEGSGNVEVGNTTTQMIKIFPLGFGVSDYSP